MKICVYLIYFWIGIRVSSLKSLDFDMGGGTFVDLIDGWNCLLADWWVVYLLWFVFAGLGLWACIFLIRYDEEKTTLYKIYLLKYKLVWDVAVTLFTVFYHYSAYT